MGRLILVTGGARSGKSRYAEKRAAALGTNITYVATCQPLDEEMQDRVRKHREQRPADWKTVEAATRMDAVLSGLQPVPDGVLLDCITLMVTGLMAEVLTSWDTFSQEEANRVEDRVREEMNLLLDGVSRLDCPMIVVTNEVGLGLVPEYPSGRLFRDCAGRANQLLAEKAEEVVLCVSGIPVHIKGEPA